MMDPVHPWVDPQEMRRLAEVLLSPPAKPAQATEDAGFSLDFVGFAQHNGIPVQQPPPGKETAAVDSPFQIVEPAQPAKSVTPESQPTPASKVRGPFLERLSRFREWLHTRGLVQGVFVLDKDGNVLFDDGNHQRLHFMARSLATAAKQSPDGAGHVQMKVGSRNVLEVIPVDTVFGRMVLGLIMEHPLNATDVAPLVTALQRAVAPPQI
jgi:hypothetical protein